MNEPYYMSKQVRNAGTGGTDISGKVMTPFGEQEVLRWKPDYGAPIFPEKLENMLCALGKKYNGNKFVEFVDIGTFGTWGAGHTGCGSKKLWGVDVLFKIKRCTYLVN